jgi:hypothetical protein
MQHPEPEYGKVVKSFTATCKLCGEWETYSHQTVIDGRSHCYKGTAELFFRMNGWVIRNKTWICPVCRWLIDEQKKKPGSYHRPMKITDEQKNKPESK